MSTIQSIGIKSVTTPQSETNQLGTGGVDFLSSLLGLQGDANPIGGMTGLEGEAFNLFLPEVPSEKLPAEAPFMDATAEGLALSQWAMPVTTPLASSVDTSKAGELGKPASFSISKPEGAPSLLSQEVSQGMLDAKNLAVLLRTPFEELPEAQVKQLVESVWGDVKDVQVESLLTDSNADSIAHKVLQLMSRTSESKEAQSVVAANASIERPEEISVRSENAALQQAGLEEAPKAQGEKKEVRQDRMPSFTISQDLRPDSSDSKSPIDPSSSGNVSHAKVMPQVLPQVQDLVQQGGGKMTLQLDPPEMGRLTIEVTTRGKQVEISIQADSEMTRNALEGGMQDLRLAMQSQDLQLTHAEVNRTSESSFSSLNFGQGSQNSGGQDSSSREGERSFMGREERTWSRNLVTENPVARYRNAGRLDVRV